MSVLRSDGGLTVTALAARLGVSRVALSRVVNGRAAVSAELAIRLAAALGGSAESWLRMQAAHDLWHAQKKRRQRIERLPDVAAGKGQAPGMGASARFRDLAEGADSDRRP